MPIPNRCAILALLALAACGGQPESPAPDLGATPALEDQVSGTASLLQAVSPHSIGLDIGVPARGWTGEAYQGHVFWDELFIFPTLNLRIPEITRSLLLYRHRRPAPPRGGQCPSQHPRSFARGF